MGSSHFKVKNTHKKQATVAASKRRLSELELELEVSPSETEAEVKAGDAEFEVEKEHGGLEVELEKGDSEVEVEVESRLVKRADTATPSDSTCLPPIPRGGCESNYVSVFFLPILNCHETRARLRSPCNSMPLTDMSPTSSPCLTGFPPLSPHPRPPTFPSRKQHASPAPSTPPPQSGPRTPSSTRRSSSPGTPPCPASPAPPSTSTYTPRTAPCRASICGRA